MLAGYEVFTIGIINKGCSSELLISSALKLRKSYKKVPPTFV